jgi:apolipoprotein N-acyltransferase
MTPASTETSTSSPLTATPSEVSSPPPRRALFRVDPGQSSPAMSSPVESPVASDNLSSTATTTPTPEISRLIRNARTAPATFLAALACTSASGLALYACFFPLNLGFLAWVALVPMLMLVRIPRPTRGMYTASFLGGLAFFVPALQWMRLGDISMYIAWGALSFYCALYFPLFLRLCRVSVHRLKLPLVVAAPVIWTGFEFLRSHLMTGFSWYFLAHTQYQWLPMIQIADLFGTYAISFVIVAMNVALLTLVPSRLYRRLGLLSINDQSLDAPSFTPHVYPLRSFAFAATVFCLTYLYGTIRLSHEAFPVGPRLALIQGNFVASMAPENNHQEVLFTYEDLTSQSVQHQPDVIIWPEAMFRFPLFDRNGISDENTLRSIAPFVQTEYWSDPRTKDHLKEIADRTGAASIIGITTYQAEKDRLDSYNSAVFIKPEEGIQARYDKIHLVPFGEYLPLYQQIPFLEKLTPIAADMGLDSGKVATSFNYEGYRYSPVICFEDSVPHLVRDVVNATRLPEDKLSHGDVTYRRDVDCLVNLSNDGWFHGSSEHDQHLITALFRCVENRVPLARAANMGISAFIDGDGHIIEPEVFIDGDFESEGPLRNSMRDSSGRFHRQLNAALVTPIPLDPRSSFYTTWGDWFSQLCLIATGVVFVIALTPRFQPAAI